jgi:hypothetical protein
MKKMAGIDNVEPRLNEGKAIIKLKSGNKVRFDDLVKVVRDKAFTPKEARIAVQGELLSGGAKPQLKLSGTNEVYDLTGPALAELKKFAGKTVLINGIIPAPKGKAYLKVIQLESVKPTP